ncbi:hypothetical protein ACSMXM_05430 [Pacificimonas sp. ICDLI1SI03]
MAAKIIEGVFPNAIAAMHGRWERLDKIAEETDNAHMEAHKKGMLLESSKLERVRDGINDDATHIHEALLAEVPQSNADAAILSIHLSLALESLNAFKEPDMEILFRALKAAHALAAWVIDEADYEPEKDCAADKVVKYLARDVRARQGLSAKAA